MRPAPMDALGEIQAIHGARHVDIGEKHLHVLGAGFQNGQGDIRISGLEHVKTGILQIVGCSHPNERLIFDQQDDRTVF